VLAAEEVPPGHLEPSNVSEPLCCACAGLSSLQIIYCAALGRPQIASTCCTAVARSVPRHIRPRHPTFRNPAWRIRAFTQDSRPLAMPLLTLTRHPQCSPRTRTRLLKGSSNKAMTAIERRRRRAPTCRYRHSIYRQYGSKMDSNLRRRNSSSNNNNNRNSPWALHYRRHRTECSTMATSRIRMRPTSR